MNEIVQYNSKCSKYGLSSNNYQLITKLYVEGNPLRYGDSSGNVWGALLYSAMAFAVGTAAVLTIGAAMTIATAVVNATLAASAYAQTITVASAQATAMAAATYVTNAATAAFNFAMSVSPFGTIGAGTGFAAGAAKTGTLKGALAGAEIGFKIGVTVHIAATIAVGAWHLGPAVTAIAGKLGLSTVTSYLLGFTMGGLYGEFAKAIGRNIGGHWVPKEKSLANSFNKHGYNKKAAARGEAAGDFISSAGQLGKALADGAAEAIGEKLLSYSHLGDIYWSNTIFPIIIQDSVEGLVWDRLWPDNAELPAIGQK